MTNSSPTPSAPANRPEWEVGIELRKPIPCRLGGEVYGHKPSEHELYSSLLRLLARRPAQWRRISPEGELILGSDAQVWRIWVRDPEGGQRKVDPRSIIGDRPLTLGWETLDAFRARERAGEGRIEARAELSALTGTPTGTTLWVWRPAA
jgi:hypothetical protein